MDGGGWRHPEAGTREASFVRTCLTHSLDPSHLPPEPPPDLDWDRVYRLLIAHDLGGRIYAVCRGQLARWPREVRERLRIERYRALLRGDECVRQIRMVLTALRGANIPVMVLKGWALIPTIYGGDYGQRPYQDADLLVRPQDAAAAEGILQLLGFRGTMVEPWPGYRRRYRTSRPYQLPADPAPQGQPFSIGLHWGLLDTPFYDRRMSVASLFARAQTVPVAGVDVLGLAAADHLVYSCGHLALHHTYEGGWLRLYEVASIILVAGADLDWDAVVTRASDWGLVLPVQRVLAEVDMLWPGVVPGPMRERLSRLRSTRMERWVHDIVVRHKDNRSVRVLLAWWTMPGLAKRLRYLLETVLPSPAHLRCRYGPPPGDLWPLLYLQHGVVALRNLSPSRRGAGDAPPRTPA
jgi:hypothetical protein